MLEADNTLGDKSMFKKASTQNFVGFDNSHTNQLVQKLVIEISQLEQKLGKIHADKQSIDFSLEQSFKNMLHTRKETLRDLQKQQGLHFQ